MQIFSLHAFITVRWFSLIRNRNGNQFTINTVIRWQLILIWKITYILASILVMNNLWKALFKAACIYQSRFEATWSLWPSLWLTAWIGCWVNQSSVNCHPLTASNTSCHATCVKWQTNVSQMLSWWMKSWSHSISIWDTVTKVVPLCSVCQAPSYESNLTLLAPFPTGLANLSILFILEMVCRLS